MKPVKIQHLPKCGTFRGLLTACALASAAVAMAGTAQAEGLAVVNGERLNPPLSTSASGEMHRFSLNEIRHAIQPQPEPGFRGLLTACALASAAIAVAGTAQAEGLAVVNGERLNPPLRRRPRERCIVFRSMKFAMRYSRSQSPRVSGIGSLAARANSLPSEARNNWFWPLIADRQAVKRVGRATSASIGTPVL